MPFYYYASGTDKAADAIIGDDTLRLVTDSVDMRYTTNCNKTLTANTPLYLVGTPSGDTFTLADT